MAMKPISIRLDEDVIEQLKSCSNKSEVIRNALGNDLSVKDDSKLNNCFICKNRFNDNELNVTWTSFAYVFFCDECKKEILSKTSQEWLNLINKDNPNDWDECSDEQKRLSQSQEIRSSLDKPLNRFSRDMKGNILLNTLNRDYNAKKELEMSLNEISKKRLSNSNLVSRYKRMARTYPANFKEGLDGELIAHGEMTEEELVSIHSEFVD